MWYTESIMRLLFIAILLLSGCASWTPQERILGGVSCLAAAADGYTTIRFLDNPNNWEMNPILGKHPSDTEVITYMMASQLAVLIIAHFCPKYRSWLLGGKTTVNLGFAIHNTTLDWDGEK